MKKNIIANFIGKFWSILSNFLFIPIYISYLGIEGYSLVSFSMVLFGLVAILDAGLSATLSREFAVVSNKDDEKFRTLRTLESCYFIIIIIIIGFFLIFSNSIVENWLNLTNIDHKTANIAIKIIGLGLGFQLMFRFYIGGLIGLNKQILANSLQVIWGILRNGLVIFVLMFSDKINYFFAWQAISTVILVFVVRLYLIKNINGSRFFILPRIESYVLKRIGKFAFGVLLIIIVAAINTQFDKLIITKFLSIEYLGYYTIAVSLATGITAVVNPISVATLPKLTNFYSAGKKEEALKLFHKVSKYVAVIVFSISAVLIFCSYDIIWLWTGNKELANISGLYLPFLAFGSSMLAMQYLPFNIAMANGYTKINNVLGISSLIVTVPGYYFFVQNMGAIGVAYIYAFSQTIITIFYLYFIGKKFLDSNFYLIYFREFLFPAITAFTTCWLMSKFDLGIQSRIEVLCRLITISFMVLVITALFTIPSKNIILKIRAYLGLFN